MAEVYVAEKPSVTIEGTEFICHMKRVALIPADEMADIETFCQPGAEKPTSTKWTAVFTIKQSFGTDGAWNLLNAMRKQLKTFIVKPEFGVGVGVTNPTATFEAYVPTIPFIDSEIGSATEYEISCSVIGEPAFATT